MYHSFAHPLGKPTIVGRREGRGSKLRMHFAFVCPRLLFVYTAIKRKANRELLKEQDHLFLDGFIARLNSSNRVSIYTTRVVPCYFHTIASYVLLHCFTVKRFVFFLSTAKIFSAVYFSASTFKRTRIAVPISYERWCSHDTRTLFFFFFLFFLLARPIDFSRNGHKFRAEGLVPYLRESGWTRYEHFRKGTSGSSFHPLQYICTSHLSTHAWCLRDVYAIHRCKGGEGGEVREPGTIDGMEGDEAGRIVSLLK